MGANDADSEADCVAATATLGLEVRRTVGAGVGRRQAAS